MIYSQPARSAPRQIRIRRARAGIVVVAAVAAALGYQSLAPSPSTTHGSSTASPHWHSAIPILRRPHRSELGEDGGAVPGGTTVFDNEVPAIAKLDPALLSAMRRAATDAGSDGVDFIVNGGWRSPAYEDQLRREAVAKYGSEAEAARWVATGTTSPHVTGDAIDVGPAQARAWLSAHGAAYGLCQIYANEPWHYELRPEAIDHGCPAMYADPTHDPRMQR